MKSRKNNSKILRKKHKRKTAKKMQLFKSIMNNKEAYNDEYHDNLSQVHHSTEVETLPIEDKPRKKFSPRKILILSKKFPSFSNILKSPKKSKGKKSKGKREKTSKELIYNKKNKLKTLHRKKYSDYKNAKLESTLNVLESDSTKFEQIPYSSDVLLLSDIGLIDKNLKKKQKVFKKIENENIENNRMAEEWGHGSEVVGSVLKM